MSTFQDYQPNKASQPNAANFDPNDIPWDPAPRGNPKPPPQRTAAQVISGLVEDYGVALPKDAPAPTPAELADYLLSDDCPLEVIDKFRTAALMTWANTSEPAPFPRGFFGNIIPDYWETAVVWFDAAWYALPEDVQPVHPLLPLVEAYAAHAAPMVEPERRPKGIIPKFAATPHKREIMAHLPGFDAPALPGAALPVAAPALSYLPGLEPNSPPSPALMLALFDKGGGNSLAGNGAAQPAARIFVEALLSVPTNARNGHLQQMAFTIREVAGDWLQWNLKRYRASDPAYGLNLARALADCHRIAVPLHVKRGPPGFYHPLLIRGVDGWDLNQRVVVLAQLPEGNVGPPIDRAMLRRLGTSATAWRSYLSLVFEWDKYAAHNGRLITPEIPNVLRTKGGVVARRDGSPRIEKDKPVTNARHPRAIPTGGYEPNPARIQGKGGPGGYPEYDNNDLVALAFPQSVMDDPQARYDARRRAVAAIKRIEALGGCVIEEIGSGKGQRWRVMPPMDFGSSEPA